ncbi:unnamed protein product [Lactuca virosa]|uniref:Uncharacterized protein n=1 Tax=Lactuca virosa TaxID=75947 RepID=A0AAU9PE49_9ASTR|nr:unnamed protein product [Lactuca virosa]
MDSHASCRTPPLGSTTLISFNAADSDYRLPFHIQLRLLSNTSPTRLPGYSMFKWLISEAYLTPYRKSRCNGKGYVAYRNFITRLEDRMKLQSPSHLSSPGTSGQWAPSSGPTSITHDIDSWSFSRDPSESQTVHSFVGMNCIFDQCKSMGN